MERITPLTLLAPLSLLVLSSCAAPEPEVTEVLRPVRYARAERPGVRRVSVAGVTQANVDSRLSFRVAGTIEELPVEVGELVERGQLLARLDSADYELEAERAKASLAQVQAGLRRARAEYDRVRGLYENDNASKSDLDAARSSAESATAQVDAAQKSLEQAERQLSYTSLRAPATGAVAWVAKEINEIAAQGETIVRLTSHSSPEVELAVSEVTIPLIETGMAVEVRIDALAGEVLSGRVNEVGVATADGSSTYPVTVTLDDSPPTIRSGMAAEVLFRFDGGDSDPSMVTVPQISIGEDRVGTFVFVVESGPEEGVAIVRRRAVTIGQVRGTHRIEISSGLEAGELVATAGVRRLQDGVRVKLLNEAAS